MSDQSLTGVTTRSLDTSQDIKRAEAISTRSGLARLYADQFRASRSNLRRGAVVRETTGPAVPAASGDVTQTQDVSVPGSFQDVLDAAGDFQGDSQSANQTVNTGGGGGAAGGVGGGFAGSGGGGGTSGGGGGAVDTSCPSGWRDSSGNCTDPPQGVDCITLPDGRQIGDCGSDMMPDGGGSQDQAAQEGAGANNLPPGYSLSTQPHAQNSSWTHHSVWNNGNYVAAWNVNTATGQIANIAFGPATNFHNMIYGT